MPKDKINSYNIKSGGSFTIDTTNGEMRSIPTSYTFGNDISHGEIDNSIKRVQQSSRVEHIKMNHNMSVDGTSQTSVGGVWQDVGSPELHTGQAQRAATATNKELYALISNYPDRDDGKPIFVPFPDIAQCMEEAEQITAELMPIDLPTISSPMDIPKWIAAYSASLIAQNTINKKFQLEIAAAIAIEKQMKQIETQKKYLVDKYGEEMYMTLFKSQVEAGAVYTKDFNDYSITKQDIYEAAFAEGKAERRNAFAAKIG